MSRALLLIVGLFLAPTFAQLASAKETTIATEAPAGFEELQQQRLVVLDLYFGGEKRGMVQALIAPGTVTFAEPEEVIRLLPDLIDPELVRATIADRPLDSNTALLCPASTYTRDCGVLDPPTIGVILNESRFRVDVFISPQLLVIKGPTQAGSYLPDPIARPSFISTATASWTNTEGAKSDLFLYNDLLVSRGRARIEAGLGYATETGFLAEQMVASLDLDRTRASTGIFRARGTTVLGLPRMLGVAFETQFDTRLDRDLLAGTPLVIFLNERARVEVLLGERLLSAVQLEAGNNVIDTSSFPQGTYEVEIVVKSVSGRTERERRVFSKTDRVPPVGETAFFGNVGFIEKPGTGSFGFSDELFVAAGIARRFNDQLTLEVRTEFSNDVVRAEARGILLTAFAVAEGSLSAGTDGSVGALLSVRSTGYSKLAYSFDLRHARGTSPCCERPTDPLSAPQSLVQLPFDPVREFTQASGTFAYSERNFQVGMRGYYRLAGQDKNYGLTLDGRYDLLRSDRLAFAAEASLGTSSEGRLLYAGVTLRFFGGRLSGATNSGFRTTSGSVEPPQDGFQGGGEIAFSDSWGEGQRFNASAVGQYVGGRTELGLDASFQNRIGVLDGSVLSVDGPTASSRQYNMGFRTTLIGGGDGLRLLAAPVTRSAIVVETTGARPGDSFEVLVDDQANATITGPSDLILTLPTYRQYKVRLRPKSTGLTAVDTAERMVSLFPGNVVELQWDIEPMVLVFGRLIGPDGSALADASYRWERGEGRTDREGFFQLEIARPAMLTVVDGRGAVYSVEISVPQEATDFADVGDIPLKGTQETL